MGTTVGPSMFFIGFVDAGVCIYYILYYNIYVYICIYICICICMYIYMYIYVYISVYVYYENIYSGEPLTVLRFPVLGHY